MKTSSALDPLSEAIEAFIQAESADEFQHLIQEHPELLSDKADKLLSHMIDTQDKDDVIHELRERRAILQRCHEVGVEQALVEMLDPAIADRMMQSLFESLHTFLSTDDWFESRRVLKQHPELMSDAVDRLLQQLITGLDEEDIDATDYLEQHRILLQRCREVGVEEAFTEVLKPTSKLDNASIPEDLQENVEKAIEAQVCYRQTGNREALECAIATWQEIRKHPAFKRAELGFRVAALNNGATVLIRRYWLTGTVDDLSTAIQYWNRAVQQAPEDSSNLPGYLNNLGIGLSERYEKTGNLDDLTKAIEAYNRAVDLTHEGSNDFAGYLNNLGTGFRDRYIQTGNIADLEQAIDSWEQAIEQTPPDSPERSYYLANLGNGLSDRYARTGDLDDLERTIELCEQVVEQTPEGSPDLPAYLNNLGSGLNDRYARTGSLSDLKAAIETFEQAVKQAPDGSPDLPGYLNNLAIGLSDYYAHTGKLDVLQRSIDVYEQAIRQTSQNSPSLSIYLNNLGSGLRDRYARLGKMVDLQSAIRVYEQAVRHTSDASPDLPIYLNNLGNGLRDRYIRTLERADLRRAIKAYKKAVALTPEESPAFPGYLNNLGNGLGDRYVWSGELEDLEQAIQAWQKAVEQTPDGSFALSGYLNNLGNGLRDRYVHTGNLADLKEALESHKRAVTQLPPNSPQLPVYLNNLGNGYRFKYDHSGNGIDRAHAIEAYQKACRLGKDIALEEALGASRNWGNWALEREEWQEAIEAYEYGLEASERLFQSQFLRASKEAWLRESQGLHRHAAYARARGGSLYQATEIIEQGRARLLSQVLERQRADLSRLESEAPDTYHRYIEAMDQIRILEIQDLGEPINLPTDQTLTEAFRRAYNELQAAVHAIRQISGFSDFLEDPGFDQIRKAARDVPLIYLAATKVGGLALIVLPSTENVQKEVHVVWLDDLTETVLQERLLGIAESLEQAGYLNAYRNRDASPESRAMWFDSLSRMIIWLEDVIMQPLVTEIASKGFARGVLIPAGLLGLLPLHAAAVNLGVSFTFAPNARALLMARKSTVDFTAEKLLAVENPDGSLRFSADEVSIVLDTFSSVECVHLQNQSATRDEVREAMSDCTIWHLSTHGGVGWGEPLEGGLLMADGNLTLRDFLTLQAPARLAVLSACETGIPGTELPDEVIGLPTGLLQAGVAGIVGSLWAVDDFSTALLMMRFYKHWREENQKPSQALYSAQRWLRCTTNADLADYFRQYLPEFSGERLSKATADQGFKHFVLKDPNEQPFAHPYYWAGFYYMGV